MTTIIRRATCNKQYFARFIGFAALFTLVAFFPNAQRPLPFENPPTITASEIRSDGEPVSNTQSPLCPELDLEHTEHMPWNIRQIHADVVPPLPSGRHRATVAILDSGVNTNHVDLAPNVDRTLSRSFVPSEPTIEDGNSHGSHVAGVIAAARNGKGVQGVAPDAHLVILKVLDSTGHGTWSSVLEALRYAADINVDVVNMSFSESFAVDSEDGRLLQAELDRAVARLRSTGAVVVASAGNNSVALDANTLELPAQARDVIAVSATGPIEGRQFDHFASYSNYGRDVVDVAAPGGDLVSERSYPCDMVLSAAARTNEGPNQWAWEAGTSTAAPHVAGVAALAMSRYRGMQAAFVERWIARTSDDILARGPDAQSGWGRVNAARATGFWSPPAASPR